MKQKASRLFKLTEDQNVTSKKMQLFRAVLRAPDKTIVLFKLNTQTELAEQQLGKSPMYVLRLKQMDTECPNWSPE